MIEMRKNVIPKDTSWLLDLDLSLSQYFEGSKINVLRKFY
jgi:hypothetical protein